MDCSRFDALARLIASTASRRTVLTSLFALAYAGQDHFEGKARKRKRATRGKIDRRRHTQKTGEGPARGGSTSMRCYSSSSCYPGRGHNTSGCDFSGSSLFHGKDVRGANLSGSNFAGADMRRADLRGANASNSCFVGADLLGARVGSSVNLGGTVFCGTRMPNGVIDDSGCASSTPCCQTTDNAFAITVSYVEQFYPLWFSYYQSLVAPTNQLVGPDEVTPVYQIVVAINVDTLYVSAILDLTEQPLIVTVPATPVRYSVLTVDPYGVIYEEGIPDDTAGAFALVGPGYTGSLPGDVTSILLPLDIMILIFRADTHDANGEDQTEEAEQFRTSLQLQRLCDDLDTVCPDGSQPDSSGGYTLILPVEDFAEPFKTTADGLIADDPVTFLKQLQVAVAAPNTPPLTPTEQRLSHWFNAVFGDGTSQREAFSDGAHAAHRIILDRYASQRGPTNWIHFVDIGAWGDDVIDRAAITEYIQYANGIDTAAYYHAFLDGAGERLDGQHGRVYELTFPGGALPEAERFWSLTAYTPESIELIPNAAETYAVASYSPGLQFNADGSLSIVVARRRPDSVPEANWLPVGDRPFNVMLRVYGPEGSVANNTYVPPAIVRNS